MANDGFLYSGNPGLRPERGMQLEGKLAWRGSHADGRLSVYHYELDDVIRGLPDATEVPVPFANGWKRYGNGGRARLNGLEFRGGLRSPGPWRLEAIAALQRAWFVDTGDPLPDLLPPSAGLEVIHERPRTRLLLGVQGMAPREKPSRSAGETGLPGYALLRARLDHRLDHGLQLALGVENLLDRAYRQAGDWGSALRPGRTAWMRLDWTLSSRP